MTAEVETSARWKDTLRTGIAKWATIVQWSNDGGGTWATAPAFHAGSVTSDATNQTRWSTSDLTISGVPVDQNATETGDGISPFRTRFRIRHGLDYGDSQELIGMGVYRCTAAKPDPQKDQVVLSGKSFESYLQKPYGAFPKPRQFRASSAQALIGLLIREVIPKAVITWDPAIDPTSSTPTLQSDDDRWQLIDGDSSSPSVARTLGARVYTGGDGEWIVAPPGSLADPILWRSEKGQTQFDASRELSNDGVYNVIAVKSQSTDGTTSTLKPVIVLDADPHSPTNALRSVDAGGFGPSVRYYTSSLFTSREQMSRTGQSLLAQTLGLRQAISFTRRYDPSIRPDQVGMVDTDAGALRTILDSVTYDLTGRSQLDGTARTTSSEYSGQVGEWTDSTEGGVGEDG